MRPLLHTLQRPALLHPQLLRVASPHECVALRPSTTSTTVLLSLFPPPLLFFSSDRLPASTPSPDYPPQHRPDLHGGIGQGDAAPPSELRRGQALFAEPELPRHRHFAYSGRRHGRKAYHKAIQSTPTHAIPTNLTPFLPQLCRSPYVPYVRHPWPQQCFVPLTEVCSSSHKRRSLTCDSTIR